MKKTNVHSFEIESEIVYGGYPGVIKWIGYPPGCKVEMAGLEMVEYAHTLIHRVYFHVYVFLLPFVYGNPEAM